MLEYIREQPAAIDRTLAGIDGQVESAVDLIRRRSCRRLVVTGFGSSYTAALMAKPALLRHSPLPAEIAVATDLVTPGSIEVDDETAVVLVSRSGERGWIIRALEEVHRRRATCIALTASASSMLAQSAECVVLTSEGPESAFAKTKSVATTAAALIRMALGMSATKSSAVASLERLRDLPALMASSLGDLEAKVEGLAGWIGEHTETMVTGASGGYGVALETAIKIQEAASVVAYPDQTGNALHGALGVLGPQWLFVSFVSEADLQISASLLQLVGEFRAHRLAVATRGTEVALAAENSIVVPDAGDPLLQPILSLPAGQFLAVFWAMQRNLNPDQPAFASTMLRAMLEPGRAEPDWLPAV
jgi:glucosamine 6-phosphate synthetase-like amidotransferase/phosphosugar isomerase protein